MIIFWLIAFLIFVIAEAATVGLVSVWFAIGSVAAIVAVLLKASIWVQVACFIAVSGITMAVSRPLAKKYLTPKHKPTNADRFIGMVGVVTQRIDNIEEAGEVRIGGSLWRARSESGAVIELGEKVKSLRIEGLKLIVVPEEAVKNASGGELKEENK